MIKPSDETFTPFNLNRMYSYSGPFQKSIPLAEHYGFQLVKPLDIQIPNSATTTPHVTLHTDYKQASVKNYYLNNEQLSSPGLLCHTSQASQEKGYVNLEVHGASDPFVETLLLKSAYEILQNEKYDNLVIEINSFGSEDSYQRFENEVKRFVNKYYEKLDSNFKARVKESTFNIYDIEDSDCEYLEEIVLHLPRPVAYLSEGCRNHLKDLLEHLEWSDLPYHLNPRLFPHSKNHTETVYQITSNGEVLAYGERFSTQGTSLYRNYLEIKNTNATIDIAAITICLPAGNAEKYQDYKIESDNEHAKSVYFAHSGSVAKMNTLRILQELYKEKIPVKHAIIKNTLREQLHHAERHQFPLTLILGVKEVQENTIIVRNNLANRQKAVPQSSMCSYLKRTLRTLR